MSIYLCHNDLCNNEIIKRPNKQYIRKTCSNKCLQIVREQSIDQEARSENCRKFQLKRWPKFKKSEKYKSYIKYITETRVPLLNSKESKAKQKASMIEYVASLTPQQRLEKFSRYYTMSPEAINSLNEKGADHLIKHFSHNNMRSYKGRFTPKNPKKYVGDVNGIIYRSGLEKKFMLKLDSNPDVTYWASEEIAIRYYNPVTKKYHRYYPDFIVRTSKGDKILVEIKPSRQCKPPKPPKKKTRAFMRDSFEYIKNRAKWQAAVKYADDNNAKFKIVTEKDLGPY